MHILKHDWATNFYKVVRGVSSVTPSRKKYPKKLYNIYTCYKIKSLASLLVCLKATSLKTRERIFIQSPLTNGVAHKEGLSVGIINWVFYYFAFNWLHCSCCYEQYISNQRRLTLSQNSLPVTGIMLACLGTNTRLIWRTQYRRKERTHWQEDGSTARRYDRNKTIFLIYLKIK